MRVIDRETTGVFVCKSNYSGNEFVQVDGFRNGNYRQPERAPGSLYFPVQATAGPQVLLATLLNTRVCLFRQRLLPMSDRVRTPTGAGYAGVVWGLSFLRVQ